MLEYVSTLMLGLAIACLVVSVIRKFTSRPHGKNRESPRKSIETYTSEEETLGPQYQRQTKDLELEWKIQDAHKRRKLEEHLQAIDHLFDDWPCGDDSSAAEQFNLPGRSIRLDGSSSSSRDQDHLNKSTTQSKHRRRRTQTSRQQKRNKDQSVVRLCKAPGWLNIQGPLARSTQLIIFDKIYSELQFYHYRQPNKNLHAYVHKKFDISRKDDMAVMSLIQGIHASRYMTGDTQQALKRCKQLQRDLHTYQLKNPAIAVAVVNRVMYDYYTFEGKAGKAHSALQMAVSCIEHHAPSIWTSRGFQLQGSMYDRLAQVRPRQRCKYQDLALRCFIKAKEHCLYQPCQEEEDYLYFPLLYTIETVLIKLDMPTFYTISTFPDREIVYQRLSQCVVPHCQVTEAQDMLTTVKPQATKLFSGNRYIVNEGILLCHIILNIRLTQLAISEKQNKSALNHITTAIDEWSDHVSQYTSSVFKSFPYFQQDITKTLDNLYSRLIIVCPPDTKSEPLSDSLSSEPSDAPPSGLKQLTEESRRVEKQARRDAHQFSYSSGDIHSDSQDDVPSDVN